MCQPGRAAVPADASGTRAGLEALGDRLRDPERPDIKPRNVVDVSPRHDLDEGCVNASQRAEDASDSRKTATSCTPAHFNRVFRGLMSLRRRSGWTANVIPHVWRCHCRPERTLSKSVHCLRPVEGRFATDSACPRPDLRLPDKTQTPVHAPHCVGPSPFRRTLQGAPVCAPSSETLRTLCPDHRRRPPTSSDVSGPRLRPGRLRRTGAERPTGPDSGLQTRYHHVREPHRHLVPFRSCACPVPPDSPTDDLSTSLAATVQ